MQRYKKIIKYGHCIRQIISGSAAARVYSGATLVVEEPQIIFQLKAESRISKDFFYLVPKLILFVFNMVLEKSQTVVLSAYCCFYRGNLI